jgi:hydroxyethylthiazole kinase-like uncharacterized protein yjeF
MKVSTVSQMRSLDKRAIEEFGIEAKLLMENAGHAAYYALREAFEVYGKRYLVFCGTGNNGGDGCVLARKIHADGGFVKVFILGDADKFRGAAKLNYEIIARIPLEIQQVTTCEHLQTEISDCHMIVDAIFGTGLSRDVEGLYRDVIKDINRSDKPVLSIDIPSGVHGDTGQTMGVAVQADYTITFGLPKIGNLLFPGYGLGGKLYISHISFPPVLYTDDSLKVAISFPMELHPRNKDGHKGSFGEVLFIGGASSYFGAPFFAALSFLKAGGGYSRLAAPASITPVVASKGSEIVFIPQEETASGSIALTNKRVLLELAEQMDMVVLGPGLSLEPETQQLARELAAAITKPLLIDGDGITALCEDLGIIKKRQAKTILTPHLGEMSRITGMPVDKIIRKRIPILQRTATELNATIILKGAHSLIGHPDQKVFINMSGNSGMATAGSGDVLTGTIAAMFGLNLPLEEAAQQGVFVHGLAGDLAAEGRGEDGITAQDILDYLPLAMKVLREDVNTLSKKYVGAQLI